jgi:putative ABC transport system permease protein
VSIWHLLWSNLFRRATRTWLTFLSLVIAFLLFMLLRSIATAFAGGISTEGLTRLIVDAKYSMTDNLPISYVQQIQSLDEVAVATNLSWFGGYYQDPKNSFAKYPIDPISYFAVYTDFLIDDDVLQRFANTRVGIVVSESLAARFGWRTGDVIPMRGNIWPKEDGSWDWQFELVGTFAYAASQTDVPLLLLRYDYFNESVIDWAKNQIGWITLRVSDSHSSADAIRAIDSLFENSSDPTRSTSEADYQRQFASQLGDIGLITTMILSAVFFTILLLTGNTASQAFKERIPELAVLKTLGFRDRTIAGLVLTEAVLLSLTGAAVGIAAAFVLEPYLNANLSTFIGRFKMDLTSAAMALGLALGIGLLIGAYPAWSGLRLTIVDALRER